MKRILYDVPRWNIYLHRRERRMRLVRKDDDAFLQFQDELFDRLFSGVEGMKLSDRVRDKRLVPGDTALHSLAAGLPGFDEVVEQCRGKAADAALATEWVAKMLEPLMQPTQSQQAQQGQMADATQGLEHVDVTGGGGDEKDKHDAQNDKARVEKVAELLKDDERLKKIALLAGRFKRIVITKQKTRVKHERDELADIEQGGEISRLLPSELVKFLSPQLKKVVKRDLLERKCLQYSMTATEVLGRGPLVLCIDKSSSMNGEKDIWSSAVALALLDVAHRQKRTFIILGFDDEVFQKCVVRVGNPLPKEQLCVAPRGGTNIKRVLDLALNAVETRKVMHRADIVLITDGESDTSYAEDIRERAKRNDVSIIGVGIDVAAGALDPWCDEVHVVNDMQNVDEKTAAALFGT